MVYKDVETEIRDAQSKLNELVKLSSNLPMYEAVYVNLFFKLPDFAKMNITVLNGTSFQISIISSPSNIQEIEKMLKDSAYTKNVVLSSYTPNKEGGIVASLEGDLILEPKYVDEVSLNQ